MNAYSTRDRWLDAANHGETIAEALIPWANLRDTLDTEADALRSRWVTNQVSYFEERENG